MFIHYDEVTLRVTGYTKFISPIPEQWPEPTIEIDDYDFIYPIRQYSVDLATGSILHSGATEAELADARAIQYAIIDEVAKDVENTTGKLLSSIGIEIHARRKDKDNVIALKNYMTRNDLATLDFKGVSETVPVTLQDLDIIIAEIEDYGIAMYHYKWGLEAAIGSATTVADIEAITW